NSSLLDREDADLPLCFEQTVLVLTVLLLLLALAELVFTVVEILGYHDNPAVQYTNPTLYLVTWALVFLIHDSRRFTMRRDSAVLFLFLILSVLCGVFQLQTLIRQAIQVSSMRVVFARFPLLQGSIASVPHFSFFVASYGLQLLLLIISVISDIAPEMKEAAKKNPEIAASILSLVTFHWYNSIVVKGYRKPLEMEDIWELKDADKTQKVLGTFEKHMKTGVKKAQRALEIRQRKKKQHLAATDYRNGLSKTQSLDVLVMEEKEKKEKKKSAKGDSKSDYTKGWLMLAVIRTFSGNLLQSVALKLIHDLLVFVSPQLLKKLTLIVSFCNNCICCLQALTISNAYRKESTVGETVNLMSADAQRFMDFTNFVHQLWSSPVQIVLSLVFLWQELGPSVLAGLGVMVLLIPINALMVHKARTIQVSAHLLLKRR
ncbi:hypothetical protein JD844_007019, partial [Phrynosoma platyrhinos]